MDAIVFGLYTISAGAFVTAILLTLNKGNRRNGR